MAARTALSPGSWLSLQFGESFLFTIQRSMHGPLNEGPAFFTFSLPSGTLTVSTRASDAHVYAESRAVIGSLKVTSPDCQVHAPSGYRFTPPTADSHLQIVKDHSPGVIQQLGARSAHSFYRVKGPWSAGLRDPRAAPIHRSFQ